jgi:sugar phosphate isomerase/epimerase
VKNPITFSTLACPQWPVETVIAHAARFGYDGLEWRGGGQGHIQPSLSASQRSAIRRASKAAGLMALAITAYTSFISDDPAERQSNVDELHRYADLAADMDAQYVRAFLGELPAGVKPGDSLYENMADCLAAAAEYALSVGVRIAVEPHDDFVRSSTVVPVLNRAPQPALRVIWDIANAFAAGEDPGEGFELLKARLAYVQVKDGKGQGAGWQLCSIGQGDVPLSRAFELLATNGYTGALSVEWERAWHPELDPPETALPTALQTVRELLAAAQPESA